MCGPGKPGLLDTAVDSVQCYSSWAQGLAPQNLIVFWDCLGSQTLQFLFTVVLQMFVFSSLSCLSSAPAMAPFISCQSGTSFTTVQLGLPAAHLLPPLPASLSLLPLWVPAPFFVWFVQPTLLSRQKRKGLLKTSLLLNLMLQHQGGSPLTRESREAA